jgi:hypothetical protein
MKTYSLTSALDGGEWSASRLGRFTPRERAPGTHWIEGWVGPRAVPDMVVKRKIPSPLRDSNPRIPNVQPVAQRYTDWAITALWTELNWVLQQYLSRFCFENSSQQVSSREWEASNKVDRLGEDEGKVFLQILSVAATQNNHALSCIMNRCNIAQRVTTHLMDIRATSEFTDFRKFSVGGNSNVEMDLNRNTS